MTDMDGDGMFEAEGTYLFQDDDVFMQAGDGFVCLASAFKSFDPANADNANIVGNPAEYLDNWQLQETDYSCAIVAQMAEIEEQLNIDLDEADLRQVALEKGWVSEEMGTAPKDMGKLLEHIADVLPKTPVLSVTGNHDYPHQPSPMIREGICDYPALQAAASVLIGR